MRKYSIAEIDKMRGACRALWVYKLGTVAFSFDQQREECEVMLQTYMMAGTDPDELFAHAKEVGDVWAAALVRDSKERQEVAEKFAETFKR